MRTIWLTATLVGAVACGATGTNVKPVETPKPDAASNRESWSSFADPMLGIGVDFPATPEQWEDKNSGGEDPVRRDGAGCRLDGMLFGVYRLSRDGRALAKDAEVLEAWRKGLVGITRLRPLVWDTFSGLEVSGDLKNGGEFITRAHVVGDGLIVTLIESERGTMDPKRAKRFLSSLSFAVPWTLRAFPEGGFSANVPSGAVELPLPVQLPNTLVAKAFRMGGANDPTYSVMAAAITTEIGDPEVAIPAILDELTKKGAKVIWHGAAHTNVGFAHDVLGELMGRAMRIRYVFGAGRYFALVVEATSQKFVLEPEATRFLDSLTIY